MNTIVNPTEGPGVPAVTLEVSAPVTEGITVPKHYNDRSDNLYFLFIPLAVLVTIMLLSVVVYLMARRRHKIMSKYSYVPSFSFESSDLDDDREDRETDHLLKGSKLRLEEPPTASAAGVTPTSRTSTGRFAGGSPELFA